MKMSTESSMDEFVGHINDSEIFVGSATDNGPQKDAHKKDVRRKIEDIIEEKRLLELIDDDFPDHLD